MRSSVYQYLNEIRTCYRIAADPLAFLRLVKRTEQFHLQNLLHRGSSEPGGAAEKHRIMLGGHQRDLWLRPGSGDLFIFHEIFTNECYRMPHAILPQAGTIVDLGANIGISTLFLSQLFPESRFVCVEPNPFNAAVLRRNVAWLGPRVSVIECAIAEYSGEISFSDSDWSWGGHIESEASGNRNVPCSTVSDIFRSQNIEFADLIKIDVEGAERTILSGQPDWLARVKCVVIELHDGYSFPQFEKDLAPFGFTALHQGSSAGNIMHMAVSPSISPEIPRPTTNSGTVALADERLR
jgi:FkbM family methyltransferase